MQLRLTKMILTNFRGVRHLEINPDGEDYTISGANKLGKTTLGDGLHWQLTGKDLKGRVPSSGRSTSKTFQLKPTNPDGSDMHHKECAVESFFMVDGEELVLKKIFMETHTQKRGDSKKSFTGNTNEHYINGLSVSATKFKKLLEEIATQEVFMMLLTPFYFSDGLEWKKRMEIILDISGNVDDAAVIATNEKKLGRYPSIIGTNKREEVLDQKKAAKKKINKQIDKIPVKIAENSRDQPVITEIDQKKDAKELVEINTAITEKTESVRKHEAGETSPELTAHLAEVKARITGHISTAANLLSGRTQELRNELSALNHTQKTAVLEVKRLGTKKTLAEQTLAGVLKKIKTLCTGFDTINAEVFEPVEGLVCDKCDVITPIEKQVAAANVGKATRLEDINENGVALRSQEKSVTKEIEEFGGQITKQEKIVATILIDIGKKEDDIALVDKPVTTVVNMAKEHLADLDKEREIEADIEKAKSGDTSGIVLKLQGEIDVLVMKKTDLDSRIQRLTDHAKIEKRNMELMEEEETLSGEFESVEADIFLLKEFIRAKVSLLTPNIQSKFPGIKFKLFGEAINGGIEECCEVLVDGVAFGSANDADRANTGNKIIRTLSEHYNVQMPTVVDRVESINDVEPSGSQMIKLVVTKDPELIFTNN